MICKRCCGGAQVEDYEKHENTLRLGTTRKEYNFDFFFDHATKERQRDAGQEAETASDAPSGSAPVDITDENSPRLPSVDDGASDDVTSREAESWELVDDGLSSSDDDIEVIDEEKVMIFEKLLEERRLKLATEQSEMGESFLKVSFDDGNSPRDDDGNSPREDHATNKN